MAENRRAITEGWATGLVGTIGVQLLSKTGSLLLSRTTAGITEEPVGSGRYVKTVTVEPTDYPVEHVWDDGTEYASEFLTNELTKEKVREALNGRWTDEQGNDFDLTVTDS